MIPRQLCPLRIPNQHPSQGVSETQNLVFKQKTKNETHSLHRWTRWLVKCFLFGREGKKVHLAISIISTIVLNLKTEILSCKHTEPRRKLVHT